MRRSVRPARLAAMALVMCTALAVGIGLLTALPAGAQDLPAEQQKLTAAQATWTDRPADSYSMQYEYCQGITGCQVEFVTVEFGEVVQAVNVNTGDNAFWGLTVGDMYDDIEQGIAANAFSLSATYEAATGVPANYQIKLFENGADDATSFELVGFFFNEEQATPERAQELLDAARATWTQRTSDSYTIDYDYYSGGTASGETVTVVAGQVVAAAGFFGSSIFDLTVEDLFADIQGLIDEGLTADQLGFDASGAPAFYEYTRSVPGAADSVDFRLGTFTFVDEPGALNILGARDQWQTNNARYDISYEYCAEPLGCHSQQLSFVDDELVAGSDLASGGSPVYVRSVDFIFDELTTAIFSGLYTFTGTFGAFGEPVDFDLTRTQGNPELVEFELIDFALRAGDVVNVLEPTVTCLAGNGRIDVNIVNETDAAATYRLVIGNLSARQQTVAPRSWWRSPVTGRPDGDIQVTVSRDGVVVLDTTVTVRCDSDPGVAPNGVQWLTWCIGQRGIIVAQISNGTDVAAPYVLEVGGIRRSTTAQAYGAAFRGISGRPNGTYEAILESRGQVIDTAMIEVSC